MDKTICDISTHNKYLNLLYIIDINYEYEKDLSILNKYFHNIHIKRWNEDILNINKNSIDIVIANINNPNYSILKTLFKLIYSKDLLIVPILKETSSSTLLKMIDLGVKSYILDDITDKKVKNIFKKNFNQYIENKKRDEELFLLKQYQDITDKSSIISKTDARGFITYANENFCEISEYTQSELIGKSHNIVRHPENSKNIYKDLWHTISKEKKEWQGVIRNISKSGKSYYVKSTVKPIIDANGNIIEYIALRDDITEIMSEKKQLLDKIESNNLSLLTLVQIEDYEIFSKFYNLEAIEKIEKVFGENIKQYLPQKDLIDDVYNIGDGKYALVTDFFKFLNSGYNLKDYFGKFIKNVQNSIVTIDDMEYDLNIMLSYSYGKYMIYEDAKYGLSQALKNKESMVCANDYSIAEQHTAQRNIQTIQMIKVALENYKIVSYFQPIINNETGKIEKYESLVRLINEKDEVIAPYHFLGISKKGNYYNKITHRVLENSFKILKKVNTEVSINLSTLDIEKVHTRTKLFDLLDEYKDYATRVVFELLEDENVKDFETIKTFIHKVKQRGVKIAIDDFGAGYSNFERLLDFEPDILKIDGSLIKNIENDKFSRNIVETIVLFARKQHIKTVAEFVENENIYNILNDIGIDYSQGYYFGKPEAIK